MTAVRWFGWVCLLASGALFFDQAWLLGKSTLAHALIQRAYERHLISGQMERPWSWADLAPIARLHDPQRNQTRTVLSGSTGSSLAFGVGHIDGSAFPNERGVSGLAGHRDKEFSFLQHIELGDTLWLETRDERLAYEVVDLDVVHDSDVSVLEPRTDERRALVLVTCYPFDSLTRGPLRYVVRAEQTATSQRADDGDLRGNVRIASRSAANSAAFVSR